MEIIPEQLLRYVDQEPWFLTTVTLIVLLFALAFATKAILISVRNSREIISIISPSKKSLKTLAIAEEQADQELNELARDYGADRACIGLFHNGKTSLGNVHLLSMSIKAEGGNDRYPRIAQRIQNIPLSTYGEWTRRIMTGHSVELPDTQAAQEQAPAAHLLLQQNSVKSLYVHPVVTPSGDIDGCVFLEYCRENRQLGETELDAIRARGQSIYTKLHEANNV